MRCQAVGEQCVEMIIKAIENCEDEDDEEADEAEGADEFGAQGTTGGNRRMRNRFLWDHLSCQIIYFVLYQFTSFSYIVTSVLQKVF